MNKLKLSFILLFFWGFMNAQNDTSRVAPPEPDTTANNQQKNTPAVVPTSTTTPEKQQPSRKRPKSYDDYVKKGKRPTDVKPFTDNIYYGCNLQLGYSANSGASVIYYDVSPHAGYKFNEYLSAGVQIIYNNTSYTYGTQKANYNIFGAGVFGRALFFNRIFLQVEADELSIPANYKGNAIVSRKISNEKMVGIGYKSPLGDKLSYFFMLMYDVDPDLQSPYYGNPLVPRGGISWNF